MSLDARQASTEPVRGIDDCIAYFRVHERTADQWKVGIEWETLGIVAGTRDPVPYAGERGIAALLRGFERFGYTTVLEGENPIAAQRDGLTISLEPGGQIELSGRPFKDVHGVAAEIDRHLEMLRELGAQLGHEHLAAGYRPWGTPGQARWIPKARYGVMRPFLGARGKLAEDMMAMTGSCQASFDFGSERDMGEKLRAALAVQPVITALFANSPIVNGHPYGGKAFRVQVWTDVDPARCGILPFAFVPGFVDEAYRRYAEWAYSVPMIFLRRHGRYIDTGGAPFRALVEQGIEGHRATVSDWEDHLTTLFPEARVKGVIEVRSADAAPPPLVKALAAFWKGILYDEGARDEAWLLMSSYSLADRVALMNAAGQQGLAARGPDGRTLKELAEALLGIAARGLCRQNCCGAEGFDERVWLVPLQAYADAGRSPADDALDAYAKSGDAGLGEALRVA